MRPCVCIPTAGTGSRLGALTKYINKSLVSVGYRPVISRLIEFFPADTEFVIALGYKKESVREFLTLAYPERTFHFAEVSPYEGPGSGLGLSLLACEEFLKRPFIFLSCDTLVKGAVPPADHNWAGWSEREDLSAYRTVKLNGGDVSAVLDKGLGTAPMCKPYIGLAGIFDYAAFWEAMKSGGGAAIEQGEAYGLARMLERRIPVKGHMFSWQDTGSVQGLAAADAEYRTAGGPNILAKPDEAIWFVGASVVKYSADTSFIEQRARRAKLLEGFVPAVTGASGHMYRYETAPGETLSRVITPDLFARLLEYGKSFWQRKELEPADLQGFKRGCMAFYRDKTLARAAKFYSTFDKADGTERINGMPMPRLEELFARLDWDWLAEGLPGRFHGDFHFENIIWNAEKESFTFLDWRQNFAGSLDIGDIYYDLAKLWHGLIVSHSVISRELFSASWNADEIKFDLMRPHSLVLCERHFVNWLEKNGYDVKKTKVLTALIYLNIAALHHFPYCELLYGLGKSMLCEELDGGRS